MIRPVMRISIFGARGVPAAWGGFDTVVTELAPRLVDAGHEVELYCMPKYLRDDVGDDYHGVKIVRVPTIYGKFTETVIHEFLSSLLALFRKRQDIYYVLGCRTVWAYLPMVILRRKVVINTDGLDWQRRKWGKLARLYLKSNYWLARRVTPYLVSDSKELKKFYIKNYQVSSAFLVNGGNVRDVQDRPAFSEILNAYGVSAGSYYLVVARMEPENNVDVIIREYSACSLPHPLLVVGGANYKSSYLTELQRTQDPRIRFLGAIYTDGHLEALHLGCRAYIHGHEVGGTNPSLVTAMGCGNLILAHDVNFNREVLAGNGILWSKAPGSLSKALERADHYSEEDRMALATACRRRISRYYSWSKAAHDHERYFKWINGDEASYSDSF